MGPNLSPHPIQPFAEDMQTQPVEELAPKIPEGVAPPPSTHMPLVLAATGCLMALGMFGVYATAINPRLLRKEPALQLAQIPQGCYLDEDESLQCLSSTPSASASAQIAYFLPTPTPIARETAELKLGTLSWAPTPQKVTTPEIFLEPQSATSAGEVTIELKKTLCFEVGRFSSGERLVNAYIPYRTMDANTLVVRLVKSKDESYVYLSNLISDWENVQLSSILKPGVKKGTMSIQALEAPETLEAAEMKFSRLPSTVTRFDDLANPGKVADTPVGILYHVTIPMTATKVEGVQSKNFYLKLPDATVVQYEQTYPFLSKKNIPDITWSDGHTNDMKFTPAFIRSCSEKNLGLGVVKEGETVISAKEEIGKTAAGEPVYQLRDSSNHMVVYLYDQYTSGTDGSKERPLTPQEFTIRLNHFLWQDPMGDWVVFTNDEFADTCPKNN